MTERNQFTPYGHNPYQHRQPAAPNYSAQQERIQMQRRNRGILDKVFGEDIAAQLRTPLVATVSLLAVGVAFAGIIAISYPDGGDAPENLPVIQADASDYKTQPSEIGGMDVPFQDSTVFDITQGGDAPSNIFGTGRPVENLLEPSAPAEEPVDIASLSDEQLQEVAADAEVIEVSPRSGEVESLIEEEVSAPVEQAAEEVVAKAEEAAAAPTPAPTPQKTQTVAQTQEKIPPQQLIREVDELAASGDARPDKLHAAGSSPETIAFVRSVLDQKDGKPSPDATSAQQASLAAAMNAAEPASGGDAIKAPSTTPGSYYVQLGSVTSRTGADSEWGKMQKSLPLGGLAYRVQEANLGDRGTFYRIQAGPMSKDSANALCDSIKAQKPGGCLVVK